VANATPQAGDLGVVSVVIAVRDGDEIISGELRFPRERFQPALFLQTVDPRGKAQ